MIDKTTIQISRELKRRITDKKLCEDETYENALTRLLDVIDKKELDVQT